MDDKARKSAENSRNRTRVLIAVTVVALVFGIAYAICQAIGGAPEDFANAAASWVLMGIGLAGALALLSTRE